MRRISFTDTMTMRFFWVFGLLLIVLSGIVRADDHNTEPTDTAITREVERVVEIRIDVEDRWRPAQEWVKMARALIYINEGDPFSEKVLQTSLDALKLSNKFREIHADSETVPGGLRLIFSLKPFQLIKDIRIHDNYPVFKQDLLKMMTVRVGDVYAVPEIEKQKELIAEQYRLRGFVDPQVDIEATQDQSDGHYILDIRIRKGSYYRLERLNIRGNRVFSDAVLESKMKIWQVSRLSGRTGRFAFNQTEADVKRLVQFYRDQKYAEVDIRHIVKLKPDKNTVYVNVQIDEGPKYELSFEGNTAFSRFSLRKEIVLFTDGNRGNAGLRKTVRNIRNRYREAGYAQIEVKVSDETVQQGEGALRRIRLTIVEGPITEVAAVDIRGNTIFSDKKIKKQMLIHDPGVLGKGVYAETVLEEDLFVIKTLYAAEGYNEAEVIPLVTFNEDRSLATVVIDIDEGVQTRIGSINFTGDFSIAEEKLQSVVSAKSGAPFRQTQLKADENAAAALLSEAGYPHVAVTGITDYNADRSRVDITFQVAQGPYVRMGEVFYSGDFRTKERIISRELEIEPGDPFSPKKIIEGQKRIRDMNIFDSVQLKSVGLKDKTDTVNLFIELEEKKPYFFEVGGGYQTDRGFFGRSKIGDYNLFGQNKDLWLGAEISEIGYRAESVLREPRFMGTKISYDLSVFSERFTEFNQNFGTRTFGSSLTFSREIIENLDGGLGFRYERRQQFRADGEEIPDRELEPRSILVTSPSLRYDTRDSFIRPKKGVYSDFYIDISRGVKNSLDDFAKYRLDLRFYTTPLERLTFAFLGRAGYIKPFGDDANVPSDQLFYLGGTNDVRGFDENLLRFDANGDAVGGRQTMAGSIEGRIDLGRSFELTLFIDTGSVRDVPGSNDTDEFRSSAGLGLRYHTPIGPIGFLYGWKLDPKPDEDPGRLHFTIGYTF